MEQLTKEIAEILPKGWSYLIETSNYAGSVSVFFSISKGSEVVEGKRADDHCWALKDILTYLKSK